MKSLIATVDVFHRLRCVGAFNFPIKVGADRQFYADQAKAGYSVVKMSMPFVELDFRYREIAVQPIS
ncbi:hypothetical protein [Acidisoma silvae]|uniref:Uncharacterized protein n=1 Tax=Acidisoma silvae TaxID=2802396 RepID=A0A963YWS7_9PROT|nr:hypothetical protein [Acidisoma silvae]MCB8878320.1 hypothetical protein [Acidisoma silvae]